jgi:hypothetical protein
VGWLDAKGLAEGGLLADVAIVLELAAIYLPIIGTLLSFAVPTPFAILMLRRGTRATLLAAAVAAFLISILSGPHFGWRMGVEALVGLVLGGAMRARIRPSLAFLGVTLLAATITFAAALGVIFITGLPISDVVNEFRNAMSSAAWVVATGASVFGFQSQWLAIRPTLAALGLLALHAWPMLLFLAATASVMPVVACYYALATASAEVLGYDVRAFPSPAFARLLRLGLLLVALPVVLPARELARLFGRLRPAPDRSELSQEDQSCEVGERPEALESKYK